MIAALILNDDFSMWHFRRGLISALVKHGVSVYVLTPPGPYVARLEALGARHIAVPMARFPSVWCDLKAFDTIRRICLQIRPDVVHTMTVKPNTFGILAAWAAGVPRIISLVSGLGYGFEVAMGLRQQILTFAVRELYRLAFRRVDRVWFQNREDYDYFVARGLLAPSKGVVVRSGGINLDEYSSISQDWDTAAVLRDELKLAPGSPVVVMAAARMVWSKGVREFVEAARELRPRFSRAVFVLVGPLDPSSPDPVPESFLRENESDSFRWLGFRTDLKLILHLADIVVLPSYYREGVPRTLLEGLALGKPIVAADSVGCRETVDPGVNGFLVPPRDTASVAAAVGALLADEQLRSRFGLQSRTKAEAEFDERKVIASVMEKLYGIAPAIQQIPDPTSAAIPLISKSC